MELRLIRRFKGHKYTIGDLYIDNKFFCNTLEDRVRVLPHKCTYTSQGLPCQCPEKVPHQTAIPCGEYQVSLEYSFKYQRIMPRVNDVPHFLGVLIHWGNTDKDSAGCVLVGNNSVKGKVTESRATFKKLFAIISKADSIKLIVE